MKTDEKTLKDLLIQSLSFQYSSAASIYILNGQRPPKKFGSNCYEQARNLRNVLRAAGFNEVYLMEDIVVKRHRFVMCIVNGKRFYLDPYLMHSEPIDLDAITSAYTVGSFPIISGSKSEITIEKNDNCITVTKKWPLQKRVDSFTFDLNQTSTEDIDFEDYYARAFHKKQTTLSIRCLNTATGEVDYLIHPLNQTDKRNRELVIKTSEGVIISQSSPIEFDAKLNAFELVCNASKKELIDFLRGAAELHEKLTNKKPVFPQSIVPFPY